MSILQIIKERVYLRLLPNPEMLQSAIEAGIMPSHLIGMQGPFFTGIK